MLIDAHQTRHRLIVRRQRRFFHQRLRFLMENRLIIQLLGDVLPLLKVHLAGDASRVLGHFETVLVHFFDAELRWFPVRRRIQLGIPDLVLYQ